MTGTGKEGNREQEVSGISRGLKGIAKELKVPVVALAQLSRKVEDRTDKRPQMSDLRESGGIEADADLIAFLYRPEYYGIMQDEEGNSTAGIAEFGVKKNRNGEIKPIACAFDAKLTKFKDIN